MTALRDHFRRSPGLRFIVLFGVVSLFADFTYEGARSVSGPYLGLLGAGAATVGVVAGLGEFLGYGLRLFSGLAADRTRRYWGITLAGYVVNLLAVPALALAGGWEMAAVLLVAERAGKGIRNPPRDTMLSFAATRIGQGRGYGIHEFMDQFGAVLGPLTVAGVISLTGSHRLALGTLLLPALVALAVLAALRVRHPDPFGFVRRAGDGRPPERESAPPSPGAPPEGEAPAPGAPPPGEAPGTSEARSASEAPGAGDGTAPAAESLSPGDLRAALRFPPSYWLYLGGVALLAAGFADFALVAYHFQARSILGPQWIPLAYALAMGVDAVGALAFGWSFDRWGSRVLGVAAVVSAVAAPLVFLAGGPVLAVGLGLWGVGMGAQESVMRAAVAEMIPPGRRGTAFGLYNAAYGFAWFVGSVLLGLLYEVGLGAVVACSTGLQVAAIPILWRGWRRQAAASAG